MKVSASKKTIVILTTCFLLLLFSGLALYFKDFFVNGFRNNRWYTLDNNKELLNDCEYVKDGDKVEVNCKSLIRSIKRENVEADACYSILIIPNDSQKRPYTIEICEINKNIEWVNPYDNYDKMIPANISVTYTKKNPFLYSFAGAKFTAMSDIETVNLFEENRVVQESWESIRTKYYSKETYNYFYFPESVYNDFNLQLIEFLDSRVEDVTVDGDFIVISIRTLFRGEEVVLVSRTKGVNYYDYRDTNYESGKYKFITVDNVEDIPKGVNIRPSYLYPMDRISRGRKENLFNTCKFEGMAPEEVDARQTFNPVCSNMELFDDMELGQLDEETFVSWFDGKDLSNIDFNKVAILTHLSLH